MLARPDYTFGYRHPRSVEQLHLAREGNVAWNILRKSTDHGIDRRTVVDQDRRTTGHAHSHADVARSGVASKPFWRLPGVDTR